MEDSVPGPEVTPAQERDWAEREAEHYRARASLLERNMLDAILAPQDEHNGLVAHAKRELELAGLFDEDADYGGLLGRGALDIVRLFSLQGHSGFSSAVMVDVLTKLLQYEALGPNDHKLYEDVSDISGQPPGTLLQCIRESNWFSRDGGATWYDVHAENYESKAVV